MHAEAREFATQVLAGRHFKNVVEIGGRDINGGVADLFTADKYTSLDLFPGPGVDVVTDCREWQPDEAADLVVCCEVLEHSDAPATIVAAAISYLAEGGLLLITAAGPGREPHSGHDGGPLIADEPYGNIDPEDLWNWLARLEDVSVVQRDVDVYATAVRP